MIYGWNFNNTPIPLDVLKRFADERRESGKTYRLVGVCNEPTEQEEMAIAAHNGNRIWIWQQRQVADKTWYGMYITSGAPVTAPER